MQTTEQEQIAALVAPLIAQSLTEAVKQVLMEERSVLISVLTSEVKSQLSATLKSYFEEQLATQLVIKKQEFELELQTKIDELKFQHYQQLERLGQAVELVITSHSPDEVLDEEILDEIDENERTLDSELNQYRSLEFKSEFLEEDESNQVILEDYLIQFAEFQPSELNLSDPTAEIISSTDLDEFEQSLEKSDQLLEPSLEQESEAQGLEELSFEDEFKLFADVPVDNVFSAEANENEIISQENLEPEADILGDYDPFAFLEDEKIISAELTESIPQIILSETEVIAEDNTDLIASLDNNDLEIDLEIEQGLSLFDLNSDSEPISNVDPDREAQISDDDLNIFAESVVLDDLNINSELNLEGDESETVTAKNSELDILGESDPFMDLFSDLNPDTESLELDIELDQNTLEDESELSLVTNLEVTDLEQRSSLFDLDADLEMILSNNLDELNEFESNFESDIDQEIEDLSVDYNLTFFAEAATLDALNSVTEVNKIISPDNSSEDFWQTSDPFADLIDGLSNEQVLSQALDNQVFEFDHFPEIIYEGEDEQFTFGFEQEFPNVDNVDLVSLTESDRLQLELERELEKSQNLPEISLLEIQDDDISEFADSESEDNFWEESDRLESPPAVFAIEPVNIINVWHLGIDFGYSDIRACLFNQATGQVYSLSFADRESLITNIKVGDADRAIGGFKQFLRIGIPYQNQQEWQPVLRWINNQKFSLKDFQTSVVELLGQVKAATHPDLTIKDILENLETIILGHPHSWSDAYIFNLKEAVLASGLATSLEQILVIDQAIAFIFPSLPNSSNSFTTNHQKLFIDAGAFTTTIGFRMNGENRFNDLEYAGLGINQDIVLQLLYPKTKDKLLATKFIRSGVASPNHRTDLQQFLLKTEIGIEALAIAEEIKLYFGQQPDSNLWQGNLGGKPIKINRSELEIKIIQPFIQTLNDAVDQLIAGTEPEDITNIAIAGGTMKYPVLRQWLEAKFANAQVSSLPSSDLAQGLAITPLYSQYLDINRHQYSDYFLLSEICALSLQEPLSLDSLIKKLQNRGVNGKACSDRLGQILSGRLPAGILPWQESEKSLFKPDPNLDPQLLTANLFTRINQDLYAPNPTYAQILGTYLKILESSNNQSFTEPLVFPDFEILV